MNIDELESVFKSAVKSRFEYQDISLQKVLLVDDLETDDAGAYIDKINAALGHVHDNFQIERLYFGPQETMAQLLNAIDNHDPDLICTYRNLNSSAWEFGFSLGEHLEVLTQATSRPVLVLPHPEPLGEETLSIATQVMVVTDHLTGDNRLINYALSFTPKDGRIILSHVEDEVWLNRFLDCVSKIPAIDTDLARSTIIQQITKEPNDFIKSVQESLASNRPSTLVESNVGIGSELNLYADWLKKHKIDLAVVNTKDEHQMAISGFAHAFAIEFRHIPTLLL
ncbi:MAG: hypothetical protein VYC39_00440 [Myxococcota bacterium]|nr:hypothetical protein [Myxococcota bacterium]